MAQAEFKNEEELLKVLAEKLGEASAELIKEEIDDIKSKIDNIDKINDEELSQVAAKIDALNKVIEENGGAEKLLSTISENSKVVADLKAKLEEKSKDFEGAKALLDTLNGKVSDIEGTIKTFNDYKTEVKNRLDNTDVAIKKLSDEIEAVKNTTIGIDDVNVSKEKTFSSERISKLIETGKSEVKSDVISEVETRIQAKSAEVEENIRKEIAEKALTIDVNVISEGFKKGFKLVMDGAEEATSSDDGDAKTV